MSEVEVKKNFNPDDLKKFEKLKGAESIVDQRDLEELNAVLKNEDALFKKFLGRKLEKNVQNKMNEIFSGINSTRIKDLYQKLGDKEKSALESLFELTKLENEVEKAKQREINAMIDLTKEGLSGLDFQVIMKAEELYKEGEYQKALDIAMIIAKNGSDEIKAGAYGMIKTILKNVPDSRDFKILDQTVNFSQREAWIKKMDQNISDIRREKNLTAYKDVSISKTDAFELDQTKAAKEISEKKALKNVSRELRKILKNLNDASALDFIESKYEDLKKMSNLEEGLTKQYLLDNGYLPRNGKEIKDSELQAMKNLFYYRLNYQENIKYNTKEQNAYDEVKTTKISGVTMAEVAQAKEILNQISTDPHTAMKVLLGDKNRDGKLVNTALDNEKKREKVDQGILFGGQVAQMYENAISRFGEEQVVKNIVNIIKQLHGLENFNIQTNNADGLIRAFSKTPAALIAFRKKLLSEPDTGMSMLYSGTEYAKLKVDQIRETQKKLEEQQKIVEEFYKNNEALVAQFNTQIENKQKEDLNQVRTNLQKFKDSKDYEDLEDPQKRQIDAMINQLSPDKLPSFLSSPQIKEARKRIILSAIGAAVSAVEYQGETSVGGGIGASVTHEKINQWISGSKIFDSVSAGTGLYADKSGLSLGIGLSVNGNKDLGNDVRLFYGVGAGTNVLSPKGLGINGVLGVEKLYNKSDLQQSLDKKSAKYLGVVGSAGIGIDLSNPKFDPSVISLALQGYWRQDKLEGIEIQTENLKTVIQPIFAELLQGDASVDAIAQKLQKKFPKTRGETLYETAVALHNTVKSYKSYSSQDVIDALSTEFAAHLAQNFRNENIEKIVKEGWHISQAGAGVNLSLSKLFTGFFGIGSLAVTKYKKEEYHENQDSLQRAKDGMNDLNNFEVINDAKNLGEKLGIINRLLKKNCLTYNEQGMFITLDQSAFAPDMKVMCKPDLASYIHQENGSIKLPFNADISLGKILHQGKETRVLILGAKSMNGTREINLNKENQLSFVEKGDKDPKFGEKELDKYNLEKKIISKEAEVQLNGNPSSELVTYLEQNGDALVNFRFQAQTYKKFVAKMHSRDRAESSLNDVKQLLPRELANQVKTVDDVRFIYASLSRVSQTRDKQLSGEDLATKANNYLNAIRNLSSENKAKLVENIAKVKGGAALDDTEWSLMKSMLKIPNRWDYYIINTPEGKLFHMLTPIKKLAEARTNAYLSRVSKEYGAEGAKLLETVRKQSLAKLEGKPTAHGELQSGLIGAVAGYESANEIDDKFVAAPKMVTDSLVDMIGDGLNGVKKHYLEELAKSDKAQFDYFKTQIITQLDKDTSDGAEFLKKAKDDATFIDAVLNAKTKDAKGTEVQLVNFDMKFGFFADCVNETILLGNVKVHTTVEEQAPASSDVYYYDAVVTNDAVTTAKTVGLGVIAGKAIDKGRKGSTTPEVQEGGKTEPLADLDELKAENIKVVDGENVTIDGKTYSYALVEMPDGTNGVIVYSGNETYQVFTVDGKPTLYRLDSNGNAILPNNATPVDQATVIPDNPERSGYRVADQVAQRGHAQSLIASGKIKKRDKIKR